MRTHPAFCREADTPERIPAADARGYRTRAQMSTDMAGGEDALLVMEAPPR